MVNDSVPFCDKYTLKAPPTFIPLNEETSRDSFTTFPFPLMPLMYIHPDDDKAMSNSKPAIIVVFDFILQIY
jgi:hypothetical protein